ncbi:MAG TPA: hypothetical protein VN458_07540 [Solirubrobacterales bacterium]|nr:hypothetical protein [Solirubrobacterales bacterium]
MICALTVRKLKPGTFDEFREAFMADESTEGMPSGSQFFMIRNSGDPDEVICFGLFDGTLDELRASSAYSGYDEQLAAIAPFVESVSADGMYDVVEHQTA